MANIQSQIKRNRQNEKRRLRNRTARGNARTADNNARKVLAAPVTPETRTEVLKAISALDKAAEKGIIHKNTVARRKSRLMKQLTALSKKSE